MSTTNFYHKIYRKKNDNELIAIVKGDSYTDDSKICAIAILKERDILTDELISIEQDLGADRNFGIRSGNRDVRYHTGGDRLAALFIDGIFLGIVNWFLKFYEGLESTAWIGLIAFLSFIIPYVYSILLHGYCGQTFGKMAMGVKIFDKSEKKLISYKQAFMRELVPLSILGLLQLFSLFGNLEEWNFWIYLTILMSWIMMSWALLEIGTMLFDKKRRALHDYIAGTVVLKVN